MAISYLSKKCYIPRSDRGADGAVQEVIFGQLF